MNKGIVRLFSEFYIREKDNSDIDYRDSFKLM